MRRKMQYLLADTTAEEHQICGEPGYVFICRWFEPTTPGLEILMGAGYLLKTSGLVNG